MKATGTLMPALTICLAVLMSSCALIQSEDAGVRMAVKLGTMKAIETVDISDRLDRAARIVDLSEFALESLQRQDVALRIVYDRVYAEIDWQSLEASDRFILQELLNELTAVIRQRIERSELDGNETVAVEIAVGWIRDAATDYKRMMQ